MLTQGGASAAPFTLEGVLKSCEHLGYRHAEQPLNVAQQLKRYQLQTLAWMQVRTAWRSSPRDRTIIA